MYKRDFTDKTLDELNRCLDNYFGKEITDSENWLNSLLRYFKIFNIKNAKGNYKKYVKSLAGTRELAENKIRRVWGDIEDGEKEFCFDQNEIIQSVECCKTMLDKLSSCINVDTFKSAYDFSKITLSLEDEYLKVLEYKAEMILQKNVEDYSDEDIEILAYVALTTSDEDLVTRIYSSFYSEKYDTENLKIQGVSGDMGNVRSDLYERNDEKWEKFCSVSRIYMSAEYSKYLNNPEDYSEEMINTVLRNYYAMCYLEDEHFLVASEDRELIYISGDGTLKYSVPTQVDDSLQVVSTGSIDGSVLIHHTSVEKSHKINWIDNGKDASGKISGEISDSVVRDEQFNWGEFLVEETVAIAADCALPGSGKVVQVAEKIVKKEVKKIGKETAKEVLDEPQNRFEYNKAYYKDYVSEFKMKCISTDGGYSVLPTRDSIEKINHFYEWLAANKDAYPKLYETYYPNACYENIYATGDIAHFLALDPVTLIKDLEDAHVLDDIFPN